MNDKARLLSNITFLFEASLINIWMELMFINVILTLVVTSTFSPFCNKVLIIPTCPYLAAVWILRAPPCNTKQTFQSKGIRVKYKYHNFQLVAQYYPTSKSQKFSKYTIFAHNVVTGCCSHHSCSSQSKRLKWGPFFTLKKKNDLLKINVSGPVKIFLGSCGTAAKLFLKIPRY